MKPGQTFGILHRRLFRCITAFTRCISSCPCSHRWTLLPNINSQGPSRLQRPMEFLHALQRCTSCCLKAAGLPLLPTNAAWVRFCSDSTHIRFHVIFQVSVAEQQLQNLEARNRHGLTVLLDSASEFRRGTESTGRSVTSRASAEKT